MRYTKQGVRDLNDLLSPKVEKLDIDKIMCKHKRMVECHPGCGHFHCQDCDITWDEGAEGPL